MKTTPLLNDGLDGMPAKRVLNYVEKKKEEGAPIAGIYCGYAPIELMQAMDVIPAVLCAFAEKPITTAEEVLPANLCPLIKSSYGFILEGSYPFFNMADVVIAETTCDGKKKMFELAAEVKPLHVMDLPQMPESGEALKNWTVMIQKLGTFLETTLDRSLSMDRLEEVIKKNNERNRLMTKLYDYAALTPPVISWEEMYDIGFLALPAMADDSIPLINELLGRLEKRVEEGVYFGSEDSPRVLVTGCPAGGDALKVFKIIEECGGVVVVPDSCTGMKTFAGEIEEGTDNPLKAIARRYLDIPCSCMTPNSKRYEALSDMIERFKPDVVVDFILTACHAYNVESYSIGRHVMEKHDLPYLKIESGYSENDKEQIRTKIEALFEIAL